MKEYWSYYNRYMLIIMISCFIMSVCVDEQYIVSKYCGDHTGVVILYLCCIVSTINIVSKIMKWFWTNYAIYSQLILRLELIQTNSKESILTNFTLDPFEISSETIPKSMLNCEMSRMNSGTVLVLL